MPPPNLNDTLRTNDQMGRREQSITWVWRTPVKTGAALAVLLALAGGTTVSYLKYLDAEQQKDCADDRWKEAERQTAIARVREQEALLAAAKARRERDFLANIFQIAETDVLEGNITASQIRAQAEKRVDHNRRQEAEKQAGIAMARANEALHEAVKAKKERDFLVSIFQTAEIDPGGDITARQILAQAQQRIPEEFADQPELRGELVELIRKAQRGIAQRVPQGMILEVRGTVQLQSASGARLAPVPQALVHLDDRVTVSGDGQVQLVFLSDLHRERIKPGRRVAVGLKGCEPPDAVERDNSVLMTFVPLPKGTFYMGWDGQEKGVQTEIEEDFEIAVHAVTQGQWEAVMGNNPSAFSRQGRSKDLIFDITDEELKLFPVESVSWDDTAAFLTKLNEKESGSGFVYRLPSAAEWEYACRGGATSEEECSYHFYFGKPTNHLSSEQANCSGQRPTRVGAYPPNKLGLCDMHGNMSQWCGDAALDGSSKRVSMGGSWRHTSAYCHAAFRGWTPPTSRDSNDGFRLARVPVPRP